MAAAAGACPRVRAGSGSALVPDGQPHIRAPGWGHLGVPVFAERRARSTSCSCAPPELGHLQRKLLVSLVHHIHLGVGSQAF